MSEILYERFPRVLHGSPEKSFVKVTTHGHCGFTGDIRQRPPSALPSNALVLGALRCQRPDRRGPRRAGGWLTGTYVTPSVRSVKTARDRYTPVRRNPPRTRPPCAGTTQSGRRFSTPVTDSSSKSQRPPHAPHPALSANLHPHWHRRLTCVSRPRNLSGLPGRRRPRSCCRRSWPRACRGRSSSTSWRRSSSRPTSRPCGPSAGTGATPSLTKRSG